MPHARAGEMTVCVFACLRRTLVHVARPPAGRLDHPAQAPVVQVLAGVGQIHEALRQAMSMAGRYDDGPADIAQLLRRGAGFGEQQMQVGTLHQGWASVPKRVGS